jgi:hypothetical protein
MNYAKLSENNSTYRNIKRKQKLEINLTSKVHSLKTAILLKGIKKT